MVSSRSDTKRRKRDSSPLNANPKRTKVHAQRKFAQGVNALNTLLNLTPGKEKSEKSRSNGLNSSGSQSNSQSGDDNSDNKKDVAASGKRALPARGAKKPSIEDMITFLCYRGTSALPPHLVHLNKAPSPDPTLQPQPKSAETSRVKLADKTNRDGDKGNNKKTLKAASSSAQKAVTAAQALKRKYQEQRIKKTTVSTLASKVKGAPLLPILRTTRSSAVARTALASSSKSHPKKIVVKKKVVASPVKKKDAPSRDSLSPKKLDKSSSGSRPSLSNRSASNVKSLSASRCGLRSSGSVPDGVLRSGVRKTGSHSSPPKKKNARQGKSLTPSQSSKKLATSLSDFSSEDDQPLVKKHKPLVQVQKLIKKSIANIGRKMKLEPRRSKRGLAVDHFATSLSSSKRASGAVTQSQISAGSNDRGSNIIDDSAKTKITGKKAVVPVPTISKDSNSVSSKNRQSSSQRKDTPQSMKTSTPKMKKGYVMELVTANKIGDEAQVGTRSRRGSRDVRDCPTSDKLPNLQNLVQMQKNSPSDSKKCDSSKSLDLSKTLGSPSGSSKPSNIRLQSVAKTQVDLSLSTVLKSPPDLRIPAAIKRPLTAVGITNPMAIAAAAAVVCKSSNAKADGKLKDEITHSVNVIKEKRGETKGSLNVSAKSPPKSKSIKMETDKSKPRPGNSPERKVLDARKETKQERTKSVSLTKKIDADSSDEDSKPIISMSTKNVKKTKINIESGDSGFERTSEKDSQMNTRFKRKTQDRGDTIEINKMSSDDEGSKPISRAKRSTNRSLKKVLSSDDEASKTAFLIPPGPQTTVREDIKSFHSADTRKKASSTEYENEVDFNLKSRKFAPSFKVKSQSSDEETPIKSTNQATKKLTRPLRSILKESSEDDESEGNDLSDDTTPPVRPSTRSSIKSKVAERKPSFRSTRSGRNANSIDDQNSESIIKPSEKSESSSDEESDSFKHDTSSVPKTRSKTVKKLRRDPRTTHKSSGDESDEKLSSQHQRPRRSRSFTAERNIKAKKVRSSSSESASSSVQDIVDDDEYKSDQKSTIKAKSKPKFVSDKRSSTNKNKGKSSNTMTGKDSLVSDDDSDRKLKKKRESKESDSKLGLTQGSDQKRSGSPRRSTRKSIRARETEVKNDSSVSEGSSSESYPSQTRRVLRERKGLFSFAEVDPPSDSEEDVDVIAATKASLEMITQQVSHSPDNAVDLKKGEVNQASNVSCKASKQTKQTLSEPTKPAKRVKLELGQGKKSLSKKRLKASSEEQSDLNRELEKTLRSINLSPPSPMASDKSLDEALPAVSSDVAVLSPEALLSPPSTSTSLIKRKSNVANSHSIGHRNTSKNIPHSLSSVTVPTKNLAGTSSSPLLSSSSEESILSSSPYSLTPAISTQVTSMSGTKGASVKCSPAPTIMPRQMPILAAPITSIGSLCSSAPPLPLSQALHKGSIVPCSIVSLAPNPGLNTTTFAGGSSSVMSAPGTIMSTPAPLLTAPTPAIGPTAAASAGSTMAASAGSAAVPSAIPVSLSAPMPLPISASMPVSMSIPLSVSLPTQLGIPMPTSVNVPLSVPMSGTMTLPLQMGPQSSGASSSAPFLLPVQSTLMPLSAPGQTIMKKEAGSLAGIPNQMNTSPLMVGMNPINNRTFFLSAGNSVSMAASSQQQMVQGSLMPSLLSLRLPDKPTGQQTIVAGSSLFVPFTFGNPSLIQTPGQGQPQIQTVTGVSTITAMATNIQNTVATNLLTSSAGNIQNAMAANVQNTVTSNIQNPAATNIQNSVTVNMQNTASLSPAMTLAHTQVAGTGMKRQLLLATKNGPVSNLILSVGEDGSHVLAAASPNSLPTSEGQTLMSVMQPIQSMKASGQVMSVPITQSQQTRPSTPTRPTSSAIAPKLISTTGAQSLSTSTLCTQVKKQQPTLSSNGSSSAGLATIGGMASGTSSCSSTGVLPMRTLHSSLPVSISVLSSSSTMPADKPGTASGSSSTQKSCGSSEVVGATCSSSCTTSSIVTFPQTSNIAPHLSSPSASSVTATLNSFRGPVSSATCVSSIALNVTTSNTSPYGRQVSAESPLVVNHSGKSNIKSNASATMRSAQVPVKATSSATVSSSSLTMTGKSVLTSSSSVVCSTSNKTSVSRPSMAVSSTPSSYSPVKMTLTGSAVKNFGKTEPKPAASSSVNANTLTTMTSRIPSAPAALAALKSPSSAPSSSRAVAKTGSSRKPYSTAPSYVAVTSSDAVSAVVSNVTGASKDPSSNKVLSGVSKKMTNLAVEKVPTNLQAVVSAKTCSPLSHMTFTQGTSSESSDQKRKVSEVELAPTHRTLSMLSTAFQGNIMGKERKSGPATKKGTMSLETSVSCEKTAEQVSSEKSGLDSLAEVATTLAERSAESSTSIDKRAPEHSLWTNPAQILGRETLRVPGLPITANLGSNLPTKNELAKMKSGAVLADAVEKRIVPDAEKIGEVTGPTNITENEKPAVSGLLTSGKADTPRQKVQKWLDVGTKGDVEHKGSCGLLSNGNTCTCDVMQEDISNLNSLAEVCVSMERINSPMKEEKLSTSSKILSEKRKQDNKETVKGISQAPSSPVKSSLPMNSHQMKVTWQNAFGVKAPLKINKNSTPPQPKKVVETITERRSPGGKDLLAKAKKAPVVDIQQSQNTQKNVQNQRKRDESGLSSSADESTQDKKHGQRRSLLGRATDFSHPKLDSNAFSADNESSVYAFEAETDSLPASQPFRRRSKTLSRSDEEDSTSVGSASNPITAHVSKEPVFVPIQVEIDESPSKFLSSTLEPADKNGIHSSALSQKSKSNVYYIPICGEEGNEDDMTAVAVKLGKEGPNNRVVMSAKLVKKPPMFKHPNTSHEDVLPSKRPKIEMTSSAISNELSSSIQHDELEASNSKGFGQVSGTDSKTIRDKSKTTLRETSRSSAADSSSEETSSLTCAPASSKDLRESRNSMSPASSRNRSPISEKASPHVSQNKKKGPGKVNRKSSIDSDTSDKAKSSRRGTKSKALTSRASPSPSLPSTSSSSSGPSRPSQKSNRSYNGPVPGSVSEAPVFHPTDKEFQDPYAYIEKIRPIAEKYGLCRIVAPNSFKPDCNVEDDIRFMADNQYVHKMLDRWGPNAKEMRAIVKYIAQHNIHLKHAPLVGGMELDLPRLYTTVQNFGGLMEVMDKKRWVKVAETMRIPKSAQDRASKLDEVYCKCLLPYETLKTGERDNLFEMVEVEWEMRKERRDKRLAASAAPPGQSVSESQQEDDEDEDEEEEDEEEDECIVKGRSMPLTTFYRIARNTTHMWFKGSSPSASEVENEFWRHVRDRNFHICVNAGSVDCSDPPYGFPTKNSPFAKHPWNLKVFSNSNGSVLRSLGSVIGVTVPTLHFGMVFTTCCWYRDPHGLPWIEYLHTGAKKIWYGIPECGADKFRSAMQEVAPHYVRKKALWLASDTAMVPPGMLTERKVPLCRTVQEPGQFIVVFPRAHTSSVATGYIVSESVSFAPPSWLPSAMESFREMQKCNEPPLFSLDKLIFSIAEDPKTSLHVLSTILPSAMEILEREITFQQELKKKGVNASERIERTKKKSSGKKGKVKKDVEDMEMMECDVCSTNLYLSVVVNTEDDAGYCLVHASMYLEQEKLDPSQCKLLFTYSQNELHQFCQNLLDRIEAKSGKKSSNLSGNNSDSESSTSTRN